MNIALINILLYLLMLLAIGVGIKQRAYYKPFVFILILCIVGFITQILAQVYINDNPMQFRVFNMYQLVDGIILSLFYFYIIPQRLVKMASITFGSLYTMWFIYYFSIHPLSQNTFTPFVVETPFIMFFSLWWLFITIRDEKEVKLSTHPLFWINVAHLIYFGFSVSGLGAYQQLSTSYPEVADSFLNFGRSANFVLYSLYIFGFYFSGKRG